MWLRWAVRRDDGRVWTEVRDLPGCFVAGQTVDELRGALTEAVRMFFAVA